MLTTSLIQLLFGLLSCYGKRAARLLRTVLAVMLFTSVTLLFLCMLLRGGGTDMFSPPFSAGTAFPP